MRIAENKFGRALETRQVQIGLWVALADANVAEALAGCGFDWLLIDAEHGPNDVRTVLEQLRAVAPYDVHPVVRPVKADVALVKQYLDIGVQTLLVPMVDTAEQAQLMARAMRYPPEGIRGVGAGLARAARWNQVDDYLNVANNQMCLLVQAETLEAMQNLQDIARVDGVDGVFFGPSDLCAAMGLRGQPGHPRVHDAIMKGIEVVLAAGKAAGILSVDRQLAQVYLEAGASFVAVGTDTSLLIKGAKELAGHFGAAKASPAAATSNNGY
jgi:4-hydroxy-2-oxoheptanedioate aldolase